MDLNRRALLFGASALGLAAALPVAALAVEPLVEEISPHRFWRLSASTNQWLGYRFPSPVSVAEVVFTPTVGPAPDQTTKWEIQYSNDDVGPDEEPTNWTTYRTL